MSDDVLSQLAQRLAPAPERPWRRLARPDQLPPPGSWRVWLVSCGRGWGKTRAGAEWLVGLAMSVPGDYCVLGGTFGSARDVCAEGPSGVLSVALPGEVTHYGRSLGEIRLRNGSRIHLKSADEPDRLRGHSFRAGWCDELASWRRPDDVWHSALLPSVRLDPGLICVTSTPRPTPLLRELLGRDDGTVAVVHGSTWANEANLSESALAELRERYQGTRLGRQELEGLLLEDVEGSLFMASMFDDNRVAEPPELGRIVVGVDPSATSGGDLCGIVVAGVAGSGPDAHYYLLEDASLQASPQRWATRVVAMFGKWKADRVVAEKNMGGEMVEQVLRQAAPNLPLRLVHASRGKMTRAEPVAALAEQGRLHVVGVLPELEDEACSWVPGLSRSPDRMDAMVWAVTALAEGRTGRRLTAYPRTVRRRPTPNPAPTTDPLVVSERR